MKAYGRASPRDALRLTGYNVAGEVAWTGVADEATTNVTTYSHGWSGDPLSWTYTYESATDPYGNSSCNDYTADGPIEFLMHGPDLSIPVTAQVPARDGRAPEQLRADHVFCEGPKWGGWGHIGTKGQMRKCGRRKGVEVMADSFQCDTVSVRAGQFLSRLRRIVVTRTGYDLSAPGDLVLGQQYAYDFDPIGNRVTAAEGDTARAASYTANTLNQYTQRTVPDEKDMIGTAPTNIAVTVNQNPASRQSAYWHHALEVDNASSAAYAQAVITAVYNPPGTNDPDIVTSQTGRVFVAQTPEEFTYDDDGNLTHDGRFTYNWNRENRLIKAETRNDLPVDIPRVKVEYAYDHQGRMVWKQVSTNAVMLSTRNLVWDNYNIIAETIQYPQSHITYCYVWGLDLSGSLQGAGGVGGLLAVTTVSNPGTFEP